MSSITALPPNRLVIVDQIRGIAIIGVVIFHLVWDLDFTNLIESGFASHPIWIAFGRLLAGTFMFLVGVSLVLATRETVQWQAAIKRISKIAFFALIITVATYVVFPSAFVFYGILHAIAVASILGLLLLRLPTFVILTIGITVWLTPVFYTNDAFDSRWLAWIGLSQTPPISNDLVPVFPWFGVTLVGMATARLVLVGRTSSRFAGMTMQNEIGKFLSFCGRYSLVIYMLHQPFLLAIIVTLSNWLNG
ncbi:MAG: DUF1624 domain-containing protein [Rhizobiaceae bacterium]|jgi:uncharacterized membrane protein|nr:DUF1624 domain-containing protein [Rhizobiaceae bacterium]